MSGRGTAGFANQQAQRTKFVRHRDIKLSGKEEAKEQHVLQKTCEGVCRKCVEKLHWRFQYNKYKPLTAIAKCGNCRRKCVTKAYRSWCDACAKERAKCPGCCTDFGGGRGEEDEEEDGVMEEPHREASDRMRAALWSDLAGSEAPPQRISDNQKMIDEMEEEEEEEEGGDDGDCKGKAGDGKIISETEIEVSKCENSLCLCPDCTCGPGCTCNISPEVNSIIPK
jgi:hypothetical protein